MSRWPLLLLLLGSACGPLVQVGAGAPRPDMLYTLSAPPPASVTTGQTPIDETRAVTFDVPTLAAALQTSRVPVKTSETTLQYLRGAQWAEQPNRLFQRLLAEVATHAGIAVIDQRSSGQVARNRVSGQLLDFQLDVSGPLQVVVHYSATLKSPDGIRQRQFVRTVPVTTDDPAVVMQALNLAANQTASDVAAWIASSS